MRGPPYVPPIEETFSISELQAKALQKGWAALFVTLHTKFGEPVLHVTMGMPLQKHRPKGYSIRLARLIVPRADIQTQAHRAQGRMPLGDEPPDVSD